MENIIIVSEIQDFVNRKFDWILDNKISKIALWKPINKAFL